MSTRLTPHKAGRGNGVMADKCEGRSKQTKLPCKNFAVVGRKFCRFHGGHALTGSAHPSYKHGRYSRYLPIKVAARYLEAKNDKELLSLKDDIAVTEARLSELFERIGTGESGEVWKNLKKAGDVFQKAYETSNTEKLFEAVQDIRNLVVEGQSDAAIWNELKELQEHRRKLTETENKMLIAKQQMISTEQLMIYAGVILDSIRTHVFENTEKQVGAKIVNSIAYDFDRLAVVEAS
jgi:hypothetical protein